MDDTKKIRVLFVCTGNICRSPMAEAVFGKFVADAGLSNLFEIASVATTSWEVGEKPHPGTQLVLRKNNIPLSPKKRAVQITAQDYLYYDLILVMDGENLRHMHRSDKIQRLLEYGPSSAPVDVPDPYYTGDFDYTYYLIEESCRNLLTTIRAQEKI